MKDDELIGRKNNEAFRSLNINLQKLWSVDKYDNMMKEIHLYELVETPYMMEIIVYVLPEMIVKTTEIINLKFNFIKNFSNMIKKFFKSKYLISIYKQQ